MIYAPLVVLSKNISYYGAFLAIQQSMKQRDLGSVGKILLLISFQRC